jgi:hypothetical protein
MPQYVFTIQTVSGLKLLGPAVIERASDLERNENYKLENIRAEVTTVAQNLR